jgi:hypothetical protein
MKTFHICWFIGKNEDGLDTLKGINWQAETMMQALREFKAENPSIEPYYIVEK